MKKCRGVSEPPQLPLSYDPGWFTSSRCSSRQRFESQRSRPSNEMRSALPVRIWHHVLKSVSECLVRYIYKPDKTANLLFVWLFDALIAIAMSASPSRRNWHLCCLRSFHSWLGIHYSLTCPFKCQSSNFQWRYQRMTRPQKITLIWRYIQSTRLAK